MVPEQLKRNILKGILELERINIINGYPKTKDQMVMEIEELIIKEVENFENKGNNT